MTRRAPEPRGEGLPWLRSLRARLSLFYATLLCGALLCFCGGAYAVAVVSESAESEPEADKQRELAAVRALLVRGLLGGLPLAISAAVGGSAWMTGHTLRALEDVVRTASRVSLERPGERIHCPPGLTSEVEGMVRALNQALARIDDAAAALRRFVGDAAHELRTPLAVLMLDLELCLQRPRDAAVLHERLGAALEQLGGLARLVDVLMTLARLDTGELPVQRRALDLAVLLGEVVAPYEALATERGQRLALQVEPGLCVTSDPLLLGRVVANLVDNACKFLPAGGTVQVRASRAAGLPLIEVLDDGPGLSTEDAARAGERFFRAPQHRGSVPGFGLGLALSQEFTRALGGCLSIERRPTGGVRAVVQLPCGDPDGLKRNEPAQPSRLRRGSAPYGS